MNKRKLFLGFRFFGGRHTTWGNGLGTAGELVGFCSKKDLIKWLYEEELSAPCGLGGGERISVDRKEANRLCRFSVKYFEEHLDFLRADEEHLRYDEEHYSVNYYEELLDF